jgi:murein DD-endopeptidase MepM/ murein hydrolase activator NlpD
MVRSAMSETDRKELPEEGAPVSGADSQALRAAGEHAAGEHAAGEHAAGEHAAGERREAAAELSEAPKGEAVPSEEVPSEEVPSEEAPKGEEVPSEEAPKGEEVPSEAPEPEPEPEPETFSDAEERLGQDAVASGGSRSRGVAAVAFIALTSCGLFLALRSRPLDPALVESPDAATVSMPADTVVTALQEPAREPTFRVRSLKETHDVKEAAVGKRTLTGVLSSLGVGKSDTSRVLKAFAGVRSFDKCAPKDVVVVAFAKDQKHLTAFEYELSPTEVLQAREVDGRLLGKKLALNIKKKRVQGAVAIGDDLKQSLQGAGFDVDLVRKVDEALDGHLTMADMKKGARLRFVVNELRIDDVFASYDDVTVAEYLPAVRNPAHPPKPLRVYSFPGEKGPAPAHYDARGRQPYHGAFRMPIPMARISSRFNPTRMHPVLHKVMPHNGVDFAASTGTAIYAVAPGVLKQAKDTGPCGNTVQILHPNGLMSVYCHLSKFASGLEVGEKIEGRQLVGYVGATGRVTGPHLHFAVKKGAKFVDPMSLKMGDEKVVPSARREEFGERKKEYDAMIEAIALPAAEVVSGDADTTEDEVVLDEVADE